MKIQMAVVAVLTRMLTNMKNLIIGLLIGLALPFAVDLVLFNDPTPLNITKQYEDGSFTGCMAEGLCED